MVSVSYWKLMKRKWLDDFLGTKTEDVIRCVVLIWKKVKVVPCFMKWQEKYHSRPSSLILISFSVLNFSFILLKKEVKVSFKKVICLRVYVLLILDSRLQVSDTWNSLLTFHIYYLLSFFLLENFSFCNPDRITKGINQDDDRSWFLSFDDFLIIIKMSRE